MKSFRNLLIVCAAVFAVALCACGRPQKAENTNVISQSEEAEETALPLADTVAYDKLTFRGPFVALWFLGETCTIEDPAIAGSVWELLAIDDCAATARYYSGEETIRLTFEASGIEQQLAVYGNDTAYCENTETRCELAPGTYDALFSLLSDYISENLIPDIDMDFLDIDTESAELLLFIRDDISFYISPAKAGDFTAAWSLAETAPPENTAFESGIAIHHICTESGYKNVDLYISPDERLIQISYAGQFLTFSMDEETAKLIEEQFWTLRLRAEGP